MNEPTKADALHATADEEVKDHGTKVSVASRQVRGKLGQGPEVQGQVAKSAAAGRRVCEVFWTRLFAPERRGD
jgi:hypothetical protein